MAIAAAMSNLQEEEEEDRHRQEDDQHEHDAVMPGFRFHPTEEELIEFYLRRKVEGKRFNVELVTFLDLYRYDPWELPALAAIGEKEWYFYVPRDRKYRNGDRPNRVTTSGYWKATGADRMIKSDSLRSIGLKKTLVFYSGKAPKGIRTSWIMNEYRLPHHETERLQKAEISICRVHKRAGFEDHPSLPRSLPTKTSSSRSKSAQNPSRSLHQNNGPVTESSPSSSTNTGTSLALSNPNSYSINPLQTSHIINPTIAPIATAIFANRTSNPIDDLHKIVNNYSLNQENHYNNINTTNLFPHYSTLQQQQQQSANVILAGSSQATTILDRFWDWNSSSEASKLDDNYNIFK
ncbi:uncharacterized protein [Primulina eburnea]|uniref:uncharacterized protein n=1 Tax=Primulina eburnea TaxID=1245227 RepID=UPI003C6C3C08